MRYKFPIASCMAALLCAVLSTVCIAQSKSTIHVAKVSSEPMHSGRITTMFYGGFIELLDDLVPGMWSEMLNDRGFEGVKPMNWSYYTGEPNTCDREWQKSDSWSYDTSQPFNGKQSIKITSTRSKHGNLLQQDIYVQKGAEYIFSGYFKTDGNAKLSAKINLKTILPDGSYMTLASVPLPKLPSEWGKVVCRLKSSGTTDKTIFELETSGEGSVLVDKFSLTPANNIDGWRTDVVTTIKAAKPGVIRFGGSLQEFGYKWQNGIGERDLRQPFWNQYWGRWDTNDVGIDEFIGFCRAAGAEPLMCVSFSDGVESARDLVEYCNGDVTTKWGKKRAENGHAKPYGVKFWQVGNETTGEKYARECPTFCEAMRKVDPSITLIASDNTPLLLSTAGKYLDQVCHHLYYISDPEACEETIKEDQKIVKSAGLDHEVKMAITEWNITAAAWGLDRGKILTLQCGLYTGRFMNVLNRCSDFVGIACRSNMTNSLCSGYIVTNQSGVLKTPAYQVMKLYADHFKPIPVDVDAKIKGVDFSACKSDDGKNLTVFAVNSTEEPIQLDLNLNDYLGFVPTGGEVVMDTLDRRQPEIMNHWAAPDRVKAVGINVNGSKLTLPAYSVSAIECSVR